MNPGLGIVGLSVCPLTEYYGDREGNITLHWGATSCKAIPVSWNLGPGGCHLLDLGWPLWLPVQKRRMRSVHSQGSDGNLQKPAWEWLPVLEQTLTTGRDWESPNLENLLKILGLSCANCLAFGNIGNLLEPKWNRKIWHTEDVPSWLNLDGRENPMWTKDRT